MMASTRFSRSARTVLSSRSGSAFELQRMVLYSAPRAVSSMPCTISPTKGSVMVVTTRPMVAVRRVTRPRPMALGV